MALLPSHTAQAALHTARSQLAQVSRAVPRLISIFMNNFSAFWCVREPHVSDRTMGNIQERRGGPREEESQCQDEGFFC